MPKKGGKIFIDHLLAVLSERQTLNPKYSFNQFARDLGVSAGALHEVLYKERELSLQFAQQIQQALKIPANDFSKLAVDLLYNSKVKKIKFDKFDFSNLIAVEYVLKSAQPLSFELLKEKSKLTDENLNALLRKLIDEEVVEAKETPTGVLYSKRNLNKSDERIEIQSELEPAENLKAYSHAFERATAALKDSPKDMTGMIQVFALNQTHFQQSIFKLQQKANEIVQEIQANPKDVKDSTPYLLCLVAIPLKK